MVMMNLGRPAHTRTEAPIGSAPARMPSRSPREYAVYDEEGTPVGWLVRPVGTPAFGVNAPAVLLRRAL